MDRDQVRLSKTISHALRHAPARYDLQPDAEGWVPIPALLAALGKHNAAWRKLRAEDLAALNQRAEKQRFELADGRIRALYGHSFPTRIVKEPAIPPPILYHGTAERTVPSILRDGLRPMRRQYVHLSSDVATARQVGARKGGHPVVLAIDAHRAYEAGIRFYHGNQDTWLSDPIPPAYIQIDKL